MRHLRNRETSVWRRRQAAFPTVLCVVLICRNVVMVQSIGGGEGRSGRGPPPPPPRRSSNPRLEDDDDDWQRRQQQWRQQPQHQFSGPDVPEDLYADSSASWYPDESGSKYSGANGDYAHAGADHLARGWDDDGQANPYDNDPPTTAEFAVLPSQDDDAPLYGYDNRYDDTRQPPKPPTDPYAPEMTGLAISKRQPPPPPLGSAVPKIPIHYEFPASKGAIQGVDDAATKDGITKGDGGLEDASETPFAATASARRDLVTRYWSTRTGKAQIMTSASLLGAALGSFLSKSLIPIGGTTTWAFVFAVMFLVSTLFRNPMGELIRAVGLSMMLVMQRSWRIRRDYPTWRYIPAAVGLGRSNRRGLRPFPPARNPWRYSPRSPRDPDFNMIYAMVSMAFVGSACGGSLPIIPTWMGALAGACLFALACTWESPRGDLARTCGMRVVKAVGELWEIQADLQIIPKATVVSSQIIDKAMILDRKHRVKDRFLSLASKGYEQATKVAAQIQQQQRGGVNSDNNDDDRGGGRRGRDDRDDDGPAERGHGRRRDVEDGRSRPPGNNQRGSGSSRRDSPRGKDDRRNPDFSMGDRDADPQRQREYDENIIGRGRMDYDDDARDGRLETANEAIERPRRGRFWR